MHYVPIFDEALGLHVAGFLDRAIARYERVLLLEPEHAEAHNNLAAALAAQGRLDDAIAHYKQAILCKTDYVEAHSNLGGAFAAQGKLDDSIAAYKRALAINPRDAGVHYNLALALTARNRVDEAIAQYQAAIALNPNCAEAHNNLANLLGARNRPDDAMVHYARAVAIDPGNAEAHSNLGNALRDLGRFEAALSHYNRAIAIRPLFPEAHYHRAGVKRFHPDDADLAALEAMAQRSDLPSSKALYVHFASAKAHEDCGNYGRAFKHMRIGNALKRAQIPYDEAAVADLFGRIPAAFDKRIFDRFRGTGDPSAAPVFVVGMPRSGGTLVEQILAGHPQILALGERMDLERAFGAIAGTPFPECVASFDTATLRQIGRDYLARLPAVTNGKLRFVDKLPCNFLYIGLIRLILPNARIIHTVRDPVDTCVSCYSQLFTTGQHFSYELGELGRYYRRYRKLMDRWHAVLPAGTILDVAYENVVDDIEREARRMVAFCGLPWDDRCLHFQRAGRFIQTASAVQVRQPLFRTSVGRWRRFEFGLGALLDELRELLPATLAAHNSM